MNGRRVTIIGVMAIVVLAAANCMALRWFFVPGSRSALLILGLLPLMDVLCVGGVLGARDLIVRRSCNSFLVGLQAVGWPVAFAYAVGCTTPEAFQLAEAYFRVVLGPIEWFIGRLGGVYDDSSFAWRLFSYFCSAVALSVPLLTCTVVGGRVARRLEIWLVRGMWVRRGDPCSANA